MDTLIAQACRGDVQAMEELLAAHYQQLYKTAFLYVKNQQDALDIVQDASIKIINRLPQLKETSYVTTWMVRIVIHTALDFIKRTSRYQNYWDNTLTESATPLSQEEQLDIYEAIRRLPAHLQEVTVLHYFYGKKIKEMSTVFNQPEGTIKYQLHEARNLLRNYLVEEEIQ